MHMENNKSSIITNYDEVYKLKERIVELEQANTELQQSIKWYQQADDLPSNKELLELIFEKTPAGLALLTGEELEYQLVNPAYVALTPEPDNFPLGKRYSEIWPSAQGFQMSALLRSVILTGETIHSERHRRRYPNDVVRYFSLHIYPIQWKNKPAILEILWETSPIEYAKQTTEKAAEEAQKRADELVKTRQELAEYAARLEMSNQDLEAFAFAASHDLQEPLRKIKSFGNILIRSMDSERHPEDLSFITRINDAAERMSSMIDALLTYSRVATNAQPSIEVNLDEVVQEVVSDLEIQINRTSGKVVVSKLPKVKAEPTQMRQLMQNLISNALKFHHPDLPPLVKISGRNIDRSEHRKGPGVEIKIEDNGIGFSIENAEKIFQPFKRLHNRKQYEGSGIGLAICRKIVERHDGSLTASSVPGKGSTFIVILPHKE
jgi:signal transduction histidine kinase